MAAVLHKQLRMHRFHMVGFDNSRATWLAGWSTLRAAQRVTLTFEGQVQPSEILPSGPDLHISIREQTCETTQISWQALLVASTCMMIEQPAKHTLELCSSGAWGISRFLHLEQPWQLTICPRSSLLRGVPRTLPSAPGTYFWQNEAAAAAGWQQPDALD